MNGAGHGGKGRRVGVAVIPVETLAGGDAADRPARHGGAASGQSVISREVERALVDVDRVDVGAGGEAQEPVAALIDRCSGVDCQAAHDVAAASRENIREGEGAAVDDCAAAVGICRGAERQDAAAGFGEAAAAAHRAAVGRAGVVGTDDEVNRRGRGCLVVEDNVGAARQAAHRGRAQPRAEDQSVGGVDHNRAVLHGTRVAQLQRAGADRRRAAVAVGRQQGQHAAPRLRETSAAADRARISGRIAMIEGQRAGIDNRLAGQEPLGVAPAAGADGERARAADARGATIGKGVAGGEDDVARPGDESAVGTGAVGQGRGDGEHAAAAAQVVCGRGRCQHTAVGRVARGTQGERRVAAHVDRFIARAAHQGQGAGGTGDNVVGVQPVGHRGLQAGHGQRAAVVDGDIPGSGRQGAGVGELQRAAVDGRAAAVAVAAGKAQYSDAHLGQAAFTAHAAAVGRGAVEVVNDRAIVADIGVAIGIAVVAAGIVAELQRAARVDGGRIDPAVADHGSAADVQGSHRVRAAAGRIRQGQDAAAAVGKLRIGVRGSPVEIGEDRDVLRSCYHHVVERRCATPAPVRDIVVGGIVADGQRRACRSRGNQAVETDVVVTGIIDRPR